MMWRTWPTRCSVQLVMKAIGKLSENTQQHFLMKLRNLFTKFLCKFGFGLVKRLLPEGYRKVLVNIRKAEARAKRHLESGCQGRGERGGGVACPG